MPSPERWKRWKESDLPFLLCVAALQAAFVAGPFLVTATFFNDTLGSYGLFYDHLDSLHRFGEPAWWSPHVHWGTPTYFFGLVGIPNLGKPAFVSIGALAWALGRLGVELPAVHPFYVLYFGVLIPLLFLVGVWLVAREVFRSRAAIRYTLAVAAFSPAILLNLSDPGVTENSAYALIAAAAYLRFVAAPSRRTFWLLCASALLVSVAVSSPIMVSALPMLGMLVGASLLVSPAARAALRAVPLPHAVAALALLLATASPSVIAFAQQRDRVVNLEVGSLSYSFGNLKSGNPLQFLLASVPGVRLDWDSYRQDAAGPPSQMRVRPLRWGKELGTSYLGVLALPLAATGLVFGRRRLRVALFAMLVAAGAVLVLFAASPVLAPILLAFPILGSFNHFGDELYDGCGFLVLLFAAGLGLEAAERRPRVLRWLTLVFVGTSLFSLTLFLRWGQVPAGLGGFAALMAACFALMLVWAARLPAGGRSRLFGSGLVALTLLDVSTASFWYVRSVLHASSPVTDSGLGRRLGSSDPGANITMEMYALRTTRALIDAGVQPARLPFVAGFCAAHGFEGPTAARGAALSLGPTRSLALPDALRSEPALAPFFSAPPDASCRVDVEATAKSYNSIQLSVRAAQPGLVFVRDAWSSGWTASVNGAPTEILPALGSFKAVAVPAGASAVRLRYAPPFVGAALIGAYALLVAAAIGALRLARSGPPIPWVPNASTSRLRRGS
jgi:hypothetical protein